MRIKNYIIIVNLIVLCTNSVFAQLPSEFPINKSKYIIFDNDDHRDVYTDEYLIALSHLKDINLIAVLTTYSPNKNEYNLFVNGRKDIVIKAEESGIQNLPEVFNGTQSTGPTGIKQN